MSGPKAKPKRKMPSQKPSATKQVVDPGDGRPKRSVVEVPKPKRNIPVFGIVIGVIAVLLVAAVTLTSGSAPGSEFGEPSVSGDGLPPFQSTAGDTAIGETAPVVTGQDFDGNEVVVGEAGTPAAIVFLAHWCSHCQAEVPRVQEWLDNGGGVEGVEIVSVATSMNSAQPNFPPSAWLEREGWTSPVLLDDTDSSTLLSYGAGGFPYWVFLNADGTVAARSAGQLDIPQLEAFMNLIAASNA
ncbi:MAG: TlpA family protein disulfide reductase [Acidimicrobiia bacterium]|nr:TlpA family protein disulfide reductase [Acidimicrobiia bacterium]